MPKRQLIVSWDKVPVLMDIPLVADILGLNQEYTRRLLAEGTLPGTKVGRCWRVEKSALINWISSGGSLQPTDNTNKGVIM